MEKEQEYENAPISEGRDWDEQSKEVLQEKQKTGSSTSVGKPTSVKLGEKIIGVTAAGAKRVTQSAKSDERVIANPQIEKIPIKTKKEKKVEIQPEVAGLSGGNQEVIGVDKDTVKESLSTADKKDVSKAEKKGEDVQVDEIPEEKKVAKPKLKKDDEESEKEQNQIDETQSPLDEKKSEKNDLYTMENSDFLEVGSGTQHNNIKNLQPTDRVGSQNREILSNGQVVVVLTIDKKAWLSKVPDKDGMLHLSLYKDGNPNDKYNQTMLKVHKDKVAMLEEDKNGNIKLIAADMDPNKKKSEVKLYEDTDFNRQRIMQNNPKVVPDTPTQEKERLLNKSLENSWDGTKMNVTMNDLKKEMSPEQKESIDKMDSKILREVINHPEMKDTYRVYDEKYKEKFMERVEKGMPVIVHGDSVGSEKAYAIVTFKEKHGDNYTMATEDGKKHTIPVKEIENSLKTSDKNEEAIKSEVSKDISKAIYGGNVLERTMNSIQDKRNEKILSPEAAKQIQNERLRTNLGIDKSKNLDFNPSINENKESVLLSQIIKSENPVRTIDAHFHEKTDEKNDFIINNRLKGPYDAVKQEESKLDGTQPKNIEEQATKQINSYNNDIKNKASILIKDMVPEVSNESRTASKRVDESIKNEMEVKLPGNEKQITPAEPQTHTKTTKESTTNEKVESSTIKDEKDKLDVPITEKTNYKEYVEKMSPGDQADVKAKTAGEIKTDIHENKETLKKSEVNITEGKSITKTGEKIDKSDPQKEMSIAIIRNDKNKVEKMIENGVTPNDKHMKLMGEMKDKGHKLDSGLEKMVTNSIPSQSKSQGVKM